jgi:hypothetical protein
MLVVWETAWVMLGLAVGTFLFILLGLWLAPVVVGIVVAQNKRRSALLGALLGFFLGWVGVVIALLLSDIHGTSGWVGAPHRAPGMYRECPHCKEDMRRDASVCPHCRLRSTPESLDLSQRSVEVQEVDSAAVGAIRAWAFAGLFASILTVVDLALPWQKVTISSGLYSVSASANGFHGWGYVTLSTSMALIALFALAAWTSGIFDRRMLGVAIIVVTVLLLLATVLHISRAAAYRTIWQWLALFLSLTATAVGALVGAMELRVGNEALKTESIADSDLAV